MSLRPSLLLKVWQRSFSLNSPCTSSAAQYIDYSFSNGIIQSSLPQINSSCHNFLGNLNEDLRKVHLIKKKIQSARRDLHECFQDSDIRLVPIGSAANLLLSNSSDLDLVLLPSTSLKKWKDFMKKFSENEHFRREYLIATKKKLEAGKVGKVQQPFFKAKIPIIRLLSNRIQVDIQFGNIAPIRSSLFVRTCVEFDERVGLLAHWLTNKFQEADILDSSVGKFSKYHVNVLVIHFLQAMPYPVLPDIIQLSPWLSKENDWNNAVKVLTRQGSLYVPSNIDTPNEQSVGELAIQLIDYYSQIEFQKIGIDTRGHVFEKESQSDPFLLDIRDEYFDHPTCRVTGAPYTLKKLFSRLRKWAEEDYFQGIFGYHTFKKAEQ